MIEQFNIGDKIYHIDSPNHCYEVIKESPKGYFYAVLFHPSYADIKHISRDSELQDNKRQWFSTSEECLNARVARAERILQVEKDCRDRKI